MVIAVIGCDGRVGKVLTELAVKHRHVVLAIDKNKRIWLKASNETDNFEAKPSNTEQIDARKAFFEQKTGNEIAYKTNQIQVASNKETEIEPITDKKDDGKNISIDGGKFCKATESGKAECEPKVDVAIDFSAPSALAQTVEFCKAQNCNLVYGVTGLNFDQEQMLAALGKSVTVVRRANFSAGAKLLEKLAIIAARELKNWDCDIVEIHRKGKQDAPSGTAKNLVYELSNARGSFSATTATSIRSGTEFGTHTVIFGGDGESLTITHRAQNVEVFAKGALEEAEKLLKTK